MYNGEKEIYIVTTSTAATTILKKMNMAAPNTYAQDNDNDNIAE